ncbi:hypothetical protein HDU98_001294 [Podochytrium sp. JEL0797]|nr:hypothetical protein HDU98_001294 [Podochytrium sp. JEL0797]
MFPNLKEKFRAMSPTTRRVKSLSVSETSSPPDSAPSTPIFENDFVSNQKLNSQEELVRHNDVSRVLILYTGGTIGMKNHRKTGYTPASGFITDTLKGMRRFHDRFAHLTPDANDSMYSPASSGQGWAEANAGEAQLHQPVNLPLQYNYPTSMGKVSSVEPVQSRMAQMKPNEPTVVINGTPVMRSQLPVLVTPTSLYGKRIKYSILEYDPLMDSSNMTMEDWVKIATDIEVNYQLYDAFMVLHGTDTMAYTSSALSFMLENLGKTVIVTGSQVPLSEVRNDAIENLLGALTIAGHFVIPEVTLFFAQKLFRGNRSSKVDAYSFSAFDSPNMRPLVEVNIGIDVSWPDVLKPTTIAKFRAAKSLNPSVATLRLFPGITAATVRAFLSPPIAGVVLESFGAGNAPNNRPEILATIKEACDRGVVIVNCTQCLKGMVTDIYATGKALSRIGVVPGSDMTPECALTKLSYLLGKGIPVETCRSMMRSNLRGELTPHTQQMRFTYSSTSHNLVDTIMPLFAQQSLVSPTAGGSGSAIRTERQIREELEANSAGIEKVLIPTVLCNAAKKGDLEALEGLLEHYPSFVSVGDHDGRTPLHIAAAENQYDAVESLLLHGANVHQRDRYFHSPLFDALRGNHVLMVRLLQDAGAHFGEEEMREVVQRVRKAAFEGDLDIIRVLCECSVDLNTPGLDGRTAVHMAVSGAQIDVLRYFIEHSKRVLGESSGDGASGIEVKLNLKDRFGRTPLDDAVALNWIEGIECIELGLKELEK